MHGLEDRHNKFDTVHSTACSPSNNGNGYVVCESDRSSLLSEMPTYPGVAAMGVPSTNTGQGNLMLTIATLNPPPC